MASKSALLHGFQLGQGGLTLRQGGGADHLADGGDAVGFEEHVLGPAQADALCAELDGLGGITGIVGVGANLQAAVLITPTHNAAELAADGGVHSGDSTVIDLAGGAVQAQPVTLVIGLAPQGEGLAFLVHLDLAAAGDAAGAHAAGHHSGMRGHAPRTVRMPWATCMPSMSSGEVSRRTRMTFSPSGPHSLASSAGKPPGRKPHRERRAGPSP